MTREDKANSDSDEDSYLVPILTTKLSNVAKEFISKGVSSELIDQSFHTASDMAVKRVEELSVSMEGFALQDTLSAFLATQLPEKPFGPYRQHFSKHIVTAVLATVDAYPDGRPFLSSIDDFEDDFDLIDIKKVPGGKAEDSFSVKGALFKLRVSRADDFEKPKRVENPKILMLDIKPDPKLRKKDKRQYDANIYELVDKYVNHGANVVLSSQAIGDPTKKYLAERDIIYADQVAVDDLIHVSNATGPILKSSNYISPRFLGTAECYEEMKSGNEVFGLFSGGSRRKTATLVLHGDDEFIKEAEVDLADQISFLRDAIQDYKLVDGSTLYTDIHKYLYDKAEDVAKDSQPIIKAFADAILSMPKRRCDKGILEPPSEKTGLIGVATQLVSFELCFPTSSDDEDTCSKKKRRR